MKDMLAAGIRTAVQAGLTLLFAWLASKGIELDPEVVGEFAEAVHVIVFSLAVGLWTMIQNYLEQKIPFLTKLFSFGLVSSGPRYTETV